MLALETPKIEHCLTHIFTDYTSIDSRPSDPRESVKQAILHDSACYTIACFLAWRVPPSNSPASTARTEDQLLLRHCSNMDTARCHMHGSRKSRSHELPSVVTRFWSRIKNNPTKIHKQRFKAYVLKYSMDSVRFCNTASATNTSRIG